MTPPGRARPGTRAPSHLSDVAGEEHGPEAVLVPKRPQALGEQAGGGGVVRGLNTGQAAWDGALGHARSTAALGSWLPAQPPAPRETESAEHRPPWSPATRGSRGAWRRPGVHGSRHGALPAHRPAHSAPARHAHRGQPRPLSLHLLQTRDSSRTGPVHMRAGVSWLGGRMGADLKGDLCLRTGGWTLPEKGDLYLRRGVGLRTGAGAWARGEEEMLPQPRPRP